VWKKFEQSNRPSGVTGASASYPQTFPEVLWIIAFPLKKDSLKVAGNGKLGTPPSVHIVGIIASSR
jgi:hypothetical protein